MLIGARESSRILAHGGISRQQSPRGLGRRQSLDHDELLAACPGGVLVVRLASGAGPEASWPWVRRVEAVQRQPYLGLPAWLQIKARLSVSGRLPCVVTVCGDPVLLADLSSFVSVDDDQEAAWVDLGLETPGPWAALLHERRLVTSPGPPWLLLGEQPYLGRAAPARDRGEPVGAGRSTTWTRWA